ncbi:MAG: DoxX family protein [Acidobacteria bacterium]|nr:DoxX family protein [Acidobacteriota bacterium]
MLLAAGPGKIAVDQFFSRIPTLHKVLDRFRPAMLTIFRIATGILYWQHGAAKFGFLGGRMSEFPSLGFFAGVLEFFGGPLISLGVYTRVVAFILSGEMAVAYWMSHAPRGPAFSPFQNRGETAVLYCFIYLFLMTTGAGKWGIDGLLSRRKGKK